MTFLSPDDDQLNDAPVIWLWSPDIHGSTWAMGQDARIHHFFVWITSRANLRLVGVEVMNEVVEVANRTPASRTASERLFRDKEADQPDWIS